MNKKNVSLGLLFMILVCGKIQAQYHSPISGFNATNFSSAYGPRNVGSAEYDKSGYKYNFHPAIDMPSVHGTTVYPVADGYVDDYSYDPTM